MEGRKNSSGEVTPRAKKKDVSILGVSLNRFTPTVQFVIVCLLLFFFHMTYAYLQVVHIHSTHLTLPFDRSVVAHQELIVQDQRFPFPWFIVFLQFFYYSLFAYVESGQWRRSLSDRK